MLCQLAASNSWSKVPEADPYFVSGAAASLAIAAGRFARRAWDAVRWDEGWTPDAPWAEAESLLRCGWSPEDGGTP